MARNSTVAKTVYPKSRIGKDGKTRPLTDNQTHDLNRTVNWFYNWAISAGFDATRDRYEALREKFNNMTPLEQLDLAGLTIEAEMQGIYEAASDQGWLKNGE